MSQDSLIGLQIRNLRSGLRIKRFRAGDIQAVAHPAVKTQASQVK